MKIGYENRTCCVAGQVGIWKILVFGSKNQTQISEKLIFGPVKTGPYLFRGISCLVKNLVPSTNVSQSEQSLEVESRAITFS